MNDKKSFFFVQKKKRNKKDGSSGSRTRDRAHKILHPANPVTKCTNFVFFV